MLTDTIMLAGVVRCSILVYGRFGVQRPVGNPMDDPRFMVNHVHVATDKPFEEVSKAFEAELGQFDGDVRKAATSSKVIEEAKAKIAVGQGRAASCCSAQAIMEGSCASPGRNERRSSTSAGDRSSANRKVQQESSYSGIILPDQFDRATAASVSRCGPCMVLLEAAVHVPGDPGVKRAIGTAKDVYEPAIDLRLAALFLHQDKIPWNRGRANREAEDIGMNIEIIEAPIRFHLHGISGVVESERYGEVGLSLMNEMWRVVRGAKNPTTGINHWVYLPDKKMFIGVEIRNPQQATLPDKLESLAFELPRYLKHIHIGPYEALPQKWKDLKTALAARGEVIGSPSLEVYGHHCEDPAKLETTILIGLQNKPT